LIITGLLSIDTRSHIYNYLPGQPI